MQDFYHYMGSDLNVDVKGGIALANGIELGKQRILRRLLTPPGSYIFHVSYGAGLPAYVGQTLSPSLKTQLVGLIQAQMLLEASVAKTPLPQIAMTLISEGLVFNLTYTESLTNSLQSLNFTVTK